MTPSNKLSQLENRRMFTASLSERGGTQSLVRLALMIAAEEEPGVNIDRYEELIRTWGKKSLECCRASNTSVVDGVLNLLYGELGFRGNIVSYYDPQNSLLNRVIERRLGIPITLGVLLIATGRSAGLQIDGVGMPGHFLVRVKEDRRDAFLVDPFSGSAINREQCQQKLDEIFDGKLQLKDEHLRRIADREIIERILRNLKNIYNKAGLYRRELSVVERILLINPDSLTDVLDRGLCRERVGNLAGAINDLESCVGVRAIGPEFNEVAAHLKRVKMRLAGLN